MPYRVSTGALTVLAESAFEALAIFDRMSEGDKGVVVIRDPDGRQIDAAALRQDVIRTRH